MHTFKLERQDYIALCDLLKLTGVANSGGQAKLMIAHAEILRNGVVETRKTAKIRAGDVICYRDQKIQVES